MKNKTNTVTRYFDAQQVLVSCLLLLLLSLTACQSLPEHADGSAIRLSNGTVEVVIVPERARIEHYGFIDGPNQLWTLPEAEAYAAKIGNWNNWGGDKAWIWPQADWQLYYQRQWPPPEETDSAMVVSMGPRHVQLTSRIVPPYGVRVVRDIRLAATGTALSVRTRLVADHDAGQTTKRSFAAWTITQVPARNNGLYARMVSSDLSWHRLGDGKSLPAPERVDETRVVRVKRDGSTWAKSGFAADAFAVRQGNILFTQLAAPSPPTAVFAPGARAQVCSSPDVSPCYPPQVGPYVELEFTAPLALREQMSQHELLVVWNLYRLSADTDEQAIAEILKNVETP